MMEVNHRFADFVPGLHPPGNDASGATTPGADWRDTNGVIDGQLDKRQFPRERTFPYGKNLPYAVEDVEERMRNLDEIMRRLYIAIEAGDFAPGALHWTRELRSWMSLKFDLPLETRVKLARLFYELSLAPGIDPVVGERFSSMFMVMAR